MACNQNGRVGTLFSNENDIEIWMTQIPEIKMIGWIGVFNRSEDIKKVTISKRRLSFGVKTKKEKPYHIISNENDFELKFVWLNKKMILKDEPVEMEIFGDDVLFIQYEELTGG